MDTSGALPPDGGLPFVPSPLHDELLGSWLLRLAELYGLSLNTFLSRLAARGEQSSKTLHWFAMNGTSLNFGTLAVALRLAPADLAAMAPPSCRPHWPQEMGLCTHCLQEAASSGQPVTWYRRWMHPLAMVCDVHGIWLSPIPTCSLARVRHATDFDVLASQVPSIDVSYLEVPGTVEDSLWLQQCCLGQADAIPLPWGEIPRPQLLRLVNTLAHMTMLEGVGADSTRIEHRNVWAESPIKDFAIELDPGGRDYLFLPTLLRPRQLVLCTVGRILRRPPEARRWPKSVVIQLADAQARDWPAGALDWICPLAADLARKHEALRAEFSVSPRYFRACADLHRSLG